MAISYIIVENYKSIKRVRIDMKDINTLIGANGSGKSNIISAIKLFYDNMCKNSMEINSTIFDVNNKYSNEVKITIGYNLENVKKRCYENLKKLGSDKYTKFYNDVVDLSPDNFIELVMIVIKNKTTVWNKEYSIRKLLYNLYPIYLIDTRKINLVEWENLWLQIGDLGKLEEKAGKAFREEMQDNLLQRDQSHNVYKKIEKMLDDSSIRIRKYSPKQLAAVTAKLYFGGEKFEVNNNGLVFFSDGTNTYNFMRLFIQMLSLLTEIKIKEPTLILDEPEISLHHNYIDYICETIFFYRRNIEFIVSTHAARLIKNILINSVEPSMIYHVSLVDSHTYVKRMRLFNDDRECVRITDQHASAYFSQMIVCVEGATELELLQNPFLKLLYPVLNEIDVMPGMAEDVERRIVSPRERQHNVPILYTIDMDKVLEFNEKTRRLNLKRSELNSRDKYSYTYRRQATIGTRKRLTAMTKKCAFRYKMPLFYSNDSNLNELKKLIKEYYLQYDYFVVNTTIEGSLITKENLDIFIDFIEDTNQNVSRRIQLMTRNAQVQEKLNMYRILCGGKCDLLMGIKQLKQKNKGGGKKVEEVYSFLTERIVSKTDGWVSRWIQYYLCKQFDIAPFENDSFIKLRTKLLTEEHKSCVLSFERDFSELHQWICEIEKRYERKI